MAQKQVQRITSIKEIARLAECSIATVSNALNGKGRMGTEVRKRVFEICQRHGYLPNYAGRNLRRRRTETVALMFYPSCAAIFQNPYYAEIVEALSTELDARGYDLLLSGHDDGQFSGDPPRFVRQGKIDGIIMLGRFPRANIRRMSQFGMPLMQLDGYRGQIQIDSVTTDGFSACERIVEHLVALGHRHLVFIGCAQEDTNTDQREAGFLSALERYPRSTRRSRVIRDFNAPEANYGSLKKRLQLKHPPTAVVAANDSIALKFIQMLQADQYAVPGQVSIFGFDDDAICLSAEPTISTVRVDKRTLGRIGAERMIQRIEAPDTPPQSVTLPVELIHRDSVAPPSS